MAQSPIERLPKDIEKKPDAEIAEWLFGKDAKRELDKLAGIAPKSMKPD